ncbi:carbohydrate ABC transporter permease [Aureimonas sp. AU12]|uniref:carbohydrate ABC transporter permease n=1 Tax=Aureimonas sp. AU12 TaxID=1638161 RepID=UPI000785D329|nr:sugar ABC transporter permease [Aureimonas sp. AU12]
MSAALRHRHRVGAMLAFPAAFFLVALLIGPSIAVLGLSLTDYQFGMPGFDWVGTAQYAALASDPGLRNSLANTAVYVLTVAPVSVAGAFWLALLLQGQGRLRPLFQTVFFLPVTATLVAMATAWEVVLHPSFGIANAALTLLGFETVRFLSDPRTALGTLAVIGVWKMLGYNVLLFLAGLATIDRQLYEAAALDGADRGWGRFTLVTFPTMAPVTLFVTVITLIRSVSEFETVAVLTQGGPSGATDMLLYTLYQQAFRYFDVGAAAALAVVFLGVVGLLSILQVRLFDRTGSHG